jgi:hypothetical protein
VKVMGRWSVKTVDARPDGTGLCSRAGSALLAVVADRVGLAAGLCDTLAGTRERRGGHAPGRVFCDLAVMLADGGRCVVLHRPGRSSLSVLHHRPDRSGHRRARSPPSPARGRRGPRQDTEGNRPPGTSRSTRSTRTPRGSSSRCVRTTSSSGRNCSASTASTRSANPNDCATESCTSPATSPATPATAPFTSPSTGPGPTRSSTRSDASRRSQRPAEPPLAATTTTIDHQPDSGCPQTFRAAIDQPTPDQQTPSSPPPEPQASADPNTRSPQPPRHTTVTDESRLGPVLQGAVSRRCPSR